MTKSESQESKSPSQLIDARIKELGDWRGEMLGRLRALVKEADPEVVECVEVEGGAGVVAPTESSARARRTRTS